MNNAAAYPSRRLNLNLCADAPENELGIQYDFRFFDTPPACDPDYLVDRQVEPIVVDPNDDGAITQSATAAWLKLYGPKVVRCRTERDVAELVTNAAAHTTGGI
jgi:hypothetical protein